MELTGAELNFMEFWVGMTVPAREILVGMETYFFGLSRGRMAITITVDGVKLNQLIPLGGPPCGDQPWYPHSIITYD